MKEFQIHGHEEDITAMRISNIVAATALAAIGVIFGPAVQAQPLGSPQELVGEIIADVIDRTIDAAREEVRRNTGIDPLERGYDRSRKYEPIRGDASDEARRELMKLNEEHDRKVVQLEEELQRKLEKERSDFRREAAKEDKSEKIGEKRHKLREKVDAAYATFEEKIAEENARFDEKRSAILGKRRG
jgi:hypothetical protein